MDVKRKARGPLYFAVAASLALHGVLLWRLGTPARPEIERPLEVELHLPPIPPAPPAQMPPLPTAAVQAGEPTPKGSPLDARDPVRYVNPLRSAFLVDDGPEATHRGAIGDGPVGVDRWLESPGPRISQELKPLNLSTLVADLKTNLEFLSNFCPDAGAFARGDAVATEDAVFAAGRYYLEREAPWSFGPPLAPIPFALSMDMPYVRLTRSRRVTQAYLHQWRTGHHRIESLCRIAHTHLREHNRREAALAWHAAMEETAREGGLDLPVSEGKRLVSLLMEAVSEKTPPLRLCGKATADTPHVRLDRDSVTLYLRPRKAVGGGTTIPR